ncbi:wax ester/triacylglycerol synthase family O-acyltransferase [Moraxella catarrhalis]|uniref:wax ester/triacylglycerol synthase family O-acyltransferase n=1 Tax=Moraxella catarrhalis TaxID=480 RepID=UPI0007E32CCD|nr:wax ester/triacylglycerol synthase family O-acyltransferase [Moraxella catarrhalis]OAV19245.1 Wax ester synthase/acyl-CoA:diacylglycerol acyltransferase [Moraxella catarrhalis]OAV34004.1 Wax ester synthase/acyl-CoA:diacylglycerol acyltransferase [Moraxella catarrhalis]
MRALSIVDSLFLWLENTKQPMHVAGICVFELPNDQDEVSFINELANQIDSDAIPNFPFNQVLYHKFAWKTIRKFHIDRHCYQHSLQTGKMSEALAQISRLHEQQLDRNRPLWELHLFDNLEPETQSGTRRFLLYLKAHHAMIDGVAAMRLFQRSLSHSPDEKLSKPIWLRNIRRKESSFVMDKKPIVERFKDQIAGLKPVYQELKSDYQLSQSTASQTSKTQFISSLQAPPSILNQRIGTSRHICVLTLKKARFVQVAKRLNVSTNDMILAVCSTAIRNYLLSQNALPDMPLIAFVPISLRKNDTALGNQISFIPTNLGTNNPDAIARLRLIHDSVKAGKMRAGRMTQAEFINYTAVHYAWAGINLAMRLYPTKQAFNLIISNIPGDGTPLYLNGAKLTAMYPASVLFDGQALNISFTNYQDCIDFGITACQTALPNIQSLPSLLTQALVEYEGNEYSGNQI